MIGSVLALVGIVFFSYCYIVDGLAHSAALKRARYCERTGGCYVDPRTGTQEWMIENGMAGEDERGATEAQGD